MSYEGRDEFMCRNGHLSSYDAHYAMRADEFICPECNLGCAWWTSVDETNPLEDGETLLPGEVEYEEIAPAVTQTCNMGCVHTLRAAKYKIPPKGIGHHVR